jgi:SAM-dependent methyltransferase
MRERWDAKWLERGETANVEPNATLAAEVAHLEPGRALDVACGAGRHAIWLASLGWRVTAVDFSEVALRLGRRRAAERGVAVEWIRADLTEWEPPHASFDLVVVAFLQLPPKERRVVLRRSAATLAPGGTIVVLGHHRDNLATGADGPKDPALLYTEHELAAELPGLAVERKERVVRPSASGGREAVDALVRARAAGGHAPVASARGG